MSAPPVKKFSSDGPIRGDSAERKFGWFVPEKRRASLYEDVTCDTQPSVHRYLHRGWPLRFEDGRGTWSDDSTKLRSTDWFSFRDPGQLWERPYYKDGTSVEQQIEGAVQLARQEHLFDDFTPGWVDFLRAELQVPAFAEYGVWLATASIGRDCLSDTITHAVVYEAAQKQRAAQSYVLYAMDLEAEFGEFPTADAKQRWLEHAPWQPTRNFVERLHSITDWGEVIVATNLCYEPIVGTTIRRELGMRAAALNGDSVTPVVAGVAQQEWQWVAGWTKAFTQMCLADAEHGEANRETIAGWIEDWMPLAQEAADAVLTITEELPIGVDVAAAQARVARDVAAFHEAAGVADLRGVAA